MKRHSTECLFFVVNWLRRELMLCIMNCPADVNCAFGTLWSSFMQVISQSYSRGVSRSARKKGSARIDNPPVTACQPPLHKGALCGRFVNLPYVWLEKVRYSYVFNHNGAKRASHLTVQMLYGISPKAYYKQKEQTHRIKSCMSALFLLVLI